jgi:hypothetical protein
MSRRIGKNKNPVEEVDSDSNSAESSENKNSTKKIRKDKDIPSKSKQSTPKRGITLGNSGQAWESPVVENSDQEGNDFMPENNQEEENVEENEEGEIFEPNSNS